MEEMIGFSVVFKEEEDAVDLGRKIKKDYPLAIFRREGKELVFPYGAVALEDQLPSHRCLQCKCVAPVTAAGKYPFYFGVDQIEVIKNMQGEVVYGH